MKTGGWWLWKEALREIRLYIKTWACSPLFYKSFQMVPGWFFVGFFFFQGVLGVVPVVLVIGFGFGLHLFPVLLSLIGKQAKTSCV